MDDDEIIGHGGTEWDIQRMAEAHGATDPFDGMTKERALKILERILELDEINDYFTENAEDERKNGVPEEELVTTNSIILAADYIRHHLR